MRVPSQAAPGLPGGTAAGTVCSKPVNLLSLYPTLTELSGLPPRKGNDGPSLVPLLKNPQAEWNHVSVVHLSQPGSYGLSTSSWRYIHYANGDEELYDIAADPHEWSNLAAEAVHVQQLKAMRALAPRRFAPLVPAKIESLPALKWHPARRGSVPASKPDGSPFDVVFVNSGKQAVELFWMDREGKRRSYGQIDAGAVKRQQTRPGAVWQIATTGSGQPAGYFIVGDRTARAVVPDPPGTVPKRDKRP